MTANSSILVLAYGNPARGDDGLGAAFAARAEAAALERVTVAADYQLQCEDAALAASHARVVFVDAAISGPEPFCCRRVWPGQVLSFSSHRVEPAQVLALAAILFNARPEAYQLGVRGYEFERFCEGLSAQAAANLAAAWTFFRDVLGRGCWHELAAGSGINLEMAR